MKKKDGIELLSKEFREARGEGEEMLAAERGDDGEDEGEHLAEGDGEQQHRILGERRQVGGTREGAEEGP